MYPVKEVTVSLMEDTSPEEVPTHDHEIGVPSSGWRARSDAWELLFFAIKQRLSQPDGASTQILDIEIHRSLQLLHALELYWARPRSSVVAEIQEFVGFKCSFPVASKMVIISNY